MSERKRKSPESGQESEDARLAEEAAAAAQEFLAETEDDEAGLDAAKAGASEADAAEPGVQEFEAEIASLKDQLLRALAETENLRRRSQREREDVAKYSASPFIKDLIGVSDNLHRALDSVPPEAVADNEQLQSLLTGVEMTANELKAVFERHNVVRIDPMGEQLDPHFHEAMFEVPDPGTPSGTVVQVLQAGYRLHDRLLRAAQVGIAKGGPAPARSGDDEDKPGSRIDTTA